MDWIFASILVVIVILLLLIILFVIIKYPLQITNFFIALPRDFKGLYIYCVMTVYCYHKKFKDITASQTFDSTVEKYTNKACFYFEDEVWTYQKVQEMTLKIAKYFESKGYQKGDVVGVFIHNRPEMVCCWLGLSRIGVVASLLNYNIRLNSLQHCINVSKCKGLIFGTELTNEIQEISEELKAAEIELFSIEDSKEPEQRLDVYHINLSNELKSLDISKINKEDFGKDVHNSDIVIHVFTSGTTGLSKAVPMPHSRLYTFASVFFPAELDPKRDILLTPIPLFHVQGGLLGVTNAIFHGVPQVIVRKFSASNFWKQCIKYDVTYCQYLGEILRYLYNQPEKPEDKMHKVRVFFGNGVNPAIWEKFVKRFNVKIKEMYGSTEGNCNTMNVEAHVGAIGYFPLCLLPLLPIYFAKVDPVTGELQRDPKSGLVLQTKINEPGELLGAITKNPLREFNGYTDPEATTKKIAKDVKKKGDSFFRTGDIIKRDELGYCYFCDRTGDTYRWKGENVSTAEVEQVLLKATDYKCTTVYGVEIPGCEGKCGMAAIVDSEGTLDIDDLSENVERYLPSYARPLFIRISKTEIQMTGTFKLQKIELQKEGFNLHVVKDPVYMLQRGKYVQLDNQTFEDIINTKILL